MKSKKSLAAIGMILVLAGIIISVNAMPYDNTNSVPIGPDYLKGKSILEVCKTLTLSDLQNPQNGFCDSLP